MTIRKGESKKLIIKVNGYPLEQVQEFRYLSSLITKVNRRHVEIRSRLAMANKRSK